MLKKSLRKILSASQKHGWVMEPDCKRILKDVGISVPEFRVVTEWEEALKAADDIGYPLVCKVVSPAVIHKSDSGGVMVGIDNQRKLKSAYQKLKKLDGFKGMLMEETVGGVELIVILCPHNQRHSFDGLFHQHTSETIQLFQLLIG